VLHIHSKKVLQVWQCLPSLNMDAMIVQSMYAVTMLSELSFSLITVVETQKCNTVAINQVHFALEH